MCEFLTAKKRRGEARGHGDLGRNPVWCARLFHMSAQSSVLYKFKSSTEHHTVHFDGPHIPLPELRAKIVDDNRIVKGKDMFILELSNAQVCLSSVAKAIWSAACA